MRSSVLQDLQRFGPDRCEPVSYPEASVYVRGLVRTQYENFTVASRLLPRRCREDLAGVYAFCRWADDLADETGDADHSRDLLAWWRGELEDCYRGRVRHPVFVALEPTIRRHDIPMQPFASLIEAFERDQATRRWDTWEQLLDYCRGSANPVGHLVLYVLGYRDPRRQGLADRTCTALQLTNFWQDVRRDLLERDRIYVPAKILAANELSQSDLVEHVRGRRMLDAAQRVRWAGVMRELVERTAPLFAQGRELWPLVSARLRISLRLFTLGGEAVAAGIQRLGFDTLDRRPTVGRAAKGLLLARSLAAEAGLVRAAGPRGAVAEDPA
ncbi:MAG: squalene synthase HpnC [Phycisphaerae bacterium]|nr:squalene synthase HpnC [Phycisphaerae bacterium]